MNAIAVSPARVETRLSAAESPDHHLELMKSPLGAVIEADGIDTGVLPIQK